MMLSTNLPTCTTPSKARHQAKMTPRRTPIRIQTPRMSPSPAVSCYSTPTRRRPRSTNNTSDDRFIPNRSRLNTAQARRSLLNRVKEEEEGPVSEYKTQLRRALFGKASESTSLLGFGESANRAASPSIAENPFSQDVLRSMDATHRSTTSNKPRARSVSTTPDFVLDAPGVLPEDHLNLASVGPSIAMACQDCVCLSNRGSSVEYLECESLERVTAVKWSNYDHTLAIGGESLAEVWDASRRTLVAQLANHLGPVTALEWKGDYELLASSETGIQRYDLRLRYPEVFTYYPGHASPIAKLQWNDNILAAAGGDAVPLWDVRFSNLPYRTLEQRNVKGLEFCPMNHNVLATGGENGVQLWNVQSGTVRKTIETSAPVTSVIWSPFRKELMASYGELMAVWSFSPQVHQLAEWGQRDGGRVLSLERVRDSGRVLSLHANEMLIGWNAFGSPPVLPKKNRLEHLGGGLLELPVLR
jgi:WD40 repeat protein